MMIPRGGEDFGQVAVLYRARGARSLKINFLNQSSDRGTQFWMRYDREAVHLWRSMHSCSERIWMSVKRSEEPEVDTCVWILAHTRIRAGGSGWKNIFSTLPRCILTLIAYCFGRRKPKTQDKFHSIFREWKRPCVIERPRLHKYSSVYSPQRATNRRINRAYVTRTKQDLVVINSLPLSSKDRNLFVVTSAVMSQELATKVRQGFFLGTARI